MNVKNLEIGQGRPKVVVSFTGRNEKEIKEELKLAQKNTNDYDIIEIRGDNFDSLDLETHIALVNNIIDSLQEIPIMYTYRTSNDGGNGTKSASEYESLLDRIIDSCRIDIIDIEFFMYEDIVNHLIHRAKRKGVIVLLSNHDTKYTPHFDEILATYKSMYERGGEILKLAYHPLDGRDVLSVLSAVHDAKQRFDCEIVGISMGDCGRITRIAGGVFGSCLTYGYLNDKTAPGQVDAGMLKENLKLFE